MRTSMRYAVAAVATRLALVLTAVLAELLAPMRLFFLWCAVFVTALVAGLGPALLAIPLSLAGAAFLIFESLGSFAIRSDADLLRFAMFAAFATGISIVSEHGRRATERARISETRYRSLIEANPLPQAVWSATAEGKIVCADAWTAITGLSRAELEGGADP
jgi:K+-sensing histidine kinase KdpD